MTVQHNLDACFIERIILDAVHTLNLGRDEDHQLQIGPHAPLYGNNSGLDSLGLVALLIEIEESLRDAGWEVSLSDERAMSSRHNPFRDVPALVDYIQSLQAVPTE
jgi:acyl carrier protein